MYFAVAFLSGIVGALLMLAAYGYFSASSQKPHPTDTVLFACSLLFFFPLLIWLKYAFIPNSYEDYLERKRLRTDRKERQDLENLREDIYFGDVKRDILTPDEEEAIVKKKSSKKRSRKEDETEHKKKKINLQNKIIPIFQF